MAKTQIERGFYPISITHIKQFIKNCEQWGYGNKDTCKSFRLIKFFNNDHIFPGEEI